MERLLLRVPQSLPPTTPTTNKHNRNRGNISVLSVVWFAIAALGCTVMVQATTVVQQRADLQMHADAVALAYVSRDINAARTMATHVGVRIASTTTAHNIVTVTVRGAKGTAMASAQQSG